jgi:hypothetical protein
MWGKGGRKLTPEEVAREREIAAALMQSGADYSPVQHWAQGLARVANAGVGAFKDWQVGQQEQEGMARGKAAMDPVLEALMGSMSGTSANSYGGSGASANVPQTAEASVIREGLIARGLPEHVADGFLMNFQDESGFNPGINEAAPTVPGSRGGYGLYQLTGPRRVAYEQYAEQLGVDPANVDAQLDFMISELQGPEAKAYQSIMGTQDAGSAAAAIARDFLRPAPEHLNRRVAQYTGGQAPSRVQVASLDPSIGLPQTAAPAAATNTPSAINTLAPSLAGSQFAPALSPDGLSVADALASSGTPAAPQAPSSSQQQIAELLSPAPQQRQSILPLLLNASSDPWARQQYGDTIDMLMSNELQMQAQSNDPLRRMQIEREQLELNALRSPAPPKPIEVGGVLVDPVTFQPLYDSRQPGAAPRPMSPADRSMWGIPETDTTPYYIDESGQPKAIGGGMVINNNLGESGDAALDKSLSTDEGKLWSTYKAAGSVAASNSQDFEVLGELMQLAPQGPITGRLAEVFPGFSAAGDAATSIIKRVAPTLRAPGSGATSDIEYEGMLRSLPALRNSPDANQMVLSIMQAKAQVDMERSRIITAYQAKEINPETGQPFTAGETRRRVDELGARSIMTPEMKRALIGVGGDGEVGTPPPAIGEEVDGYVYQGGDPSNPSSWTQVN